MATADILLTRPNNLHWNILTHCRFYRLDGEVRCFARATAETTAHQGSIDRDILLGYAQKPRDDLLIIGLILGATPNGTSVTLDLSYAVQRFHRGMCQ